MFKRLTKILMIMFLLIGTIQAANVKVITKYGKTGGIKGQLNTTGDQVNGVNICPSNPTAGCDFNNDPLWSDNGTPNTGDDDTHTGDLIVRTNDIFEIIAAWSWNGTVDSGEDTLTLKSTLPSSYAWEELPGACDSTLSSITGQDMVCVRKDADKNSVGTISEDLTFAVKVLGSTVSGTQPGDISFEITGANATASTDNAGVSLTVTAAPRWNLQKSIYTMNTGYEHNGVTGYRVYYKYYIEVDEVSGATDDAPGFLGVEAMGADATFTFTDDLSGVSPNAALIECKADTWSNSSDPYQYFVASAPESSVATAQNTQTVNCVQTGSNIAVTLEHVDARLDHIPTKTRTGLDLPVNRAIAAIGVIEVFVPLEDVKNGLDGIQGNADDGSLPTTNRLLNFDPTAPSGNSNFGTNSESELDNSYNYTLYASKGSFSKGYALKHGQWVYTEGGSVGYRAGDGLLTANAEFATRLTYNNTGGTNLNAATMCDVIDANRMEIVDVIEGEQRYYHLGIYDIYLSGGFSKDDLEFEYASTYVDDSWLASNGADLNTNYGDKVANECSATGVWYSTPAEARASGLGTITKIRIKVKDTVALEPGQGIYAWIKHKVRATKLDGTPLQNGDEIINYGSIKDNDYYTSWYKPSYIPYAYPTAPTGWAGDKVTFSGGKVRIIKTVDKSSVESGMVVNFTLDSSYTNDTGTSETTTVTIKDMLPIGLSYITSSTQNASEPTIGTCADISDLGETCTADNQVLIWNLGTKTANVEITDLLYQAQIDITAPQGTITNYVMIEAPSDPSVISQRKSDINLNITIPATINLSKNVVDTSPQEPNGAPIDYEINARNGSAVTVTELDMIDILPHNADAVIKFRDITIPRNPPTAFHGSRSFERLELVAHPNSPALCDLTAGTGVKYYYTNETATNINMSPKDTSNDLGAGSIWCEGTVDGPASGCGFTKAQVTAVRASGPAMEEDAVCQMKLKMSVSGNNPDDFYNNSAGASATGVTLPVVSNKATTIIVKSSIGNYVWFDANADGIQDASETGINDIDVSLYKTDGTLIESTKTTNDTAAHPGYYNFTNLLAGSYYVQITLPVGYSISPKDSTEDTKDSDIASNGKTDTINLAIASEDLKYDAGLYKPSSIGDTIWYDTDRDGVQDAGEDCRNMNLTVKLLDASDTEVATQTTSNCTYLFTGLNEGSYKVRFELPAGYEATLKDAGGDDEKDSDFDLSTLTSDAIVLADGDDITDIDFGYFSKTSIGNFVWIDSNANGLQDAGEIGLAGVTVQLFDGANTLKETKITAADGLYIFRDLLAGDYKVKFTMPADYSLSPENQGGDDEKDSDVPSNLTTPTITLVSGQEDIRWDMGVYKVASLGDKIWVDTNGNGTQDIGEDCDGLDVVVTLLDSNISQTTSNCEYKFEGLKPDTYKVQFTLPLGYTATTKNVGTNETDSDIDASGLSKVYTLTSGENITEVDAGLLEDASLGNFVWLDANANGLQDDGEIGIKDVLVTLLNADGTQTGKTATTDANGAYSFTGLKPASYKVKITLPTGFKVSTKDAGDDTKDSDIDPTTLESDAITLASGENNTTLDAGLYSISSLGNFVWLDTNANGLQDAGEIGIKDIMIELLQADGTTTGKTTMTDDSGYYIFANLVAGDYKVKFTLPNGYTLSPNDTGDDSKDSDVDSSLITATIALGVNEQNGTIDMGIYREGSLGDFVWIDSNNDGIQSDGESCNGVEVEVTLINSNNQEKKQTTVNCAYKFEGLKPDSYKVRVTLPEGYTPAVPNIGGDDTKDSDIDMTATTADIMLHSGENITNIDAGIVKDGSLGDRVWLDNNQNGIQDADERGIENVSLILLNADGSQTGKTAITDSDGIYAFTGLKPNGYKIKIVLPDGYHVSVKDAGSDETKDSDIDTTTLTTDSFTLLSGMAEPRVDIGLYTLSELGDRVWLDTNADGLQDDGEVGIAGVEITLLDTNDNPYREATTTDASGNYFFKSLPAGEYSVKITLPEGYKVSVKDAGDDTKDSDIDPSTLTSQKVNLALDTKNHTLDIGLYKVASLGDTVWLDANNNGLQDEGESCNGREMVVTLLDIADNTIATQTTANCQYLFENLTPKSYKVQFTLPSGVTAAKSKQGGDETKDSDIDKNGLTTSYIVTSGEILLDIDAGFMQNATLGNFVWLDTNTNGIQDEGEKGIQDITVILLKSDGTPTDKTVKTDANGHYAFSDLAPDSYAVMIELPEGYVLTEKDAGNDDTKDSDVSTTTFKTEVTLLNSGENDTSWDMGIYALAELGDRVWLDSNADGIQDDSEEGIANISVYLLKEDGTLTGKDVKTDANGNYLFAGLKPDTYKVGFVFPEVYQVTLQDKTDEAKDSDVNIETNTTETIMIESGEKNRTIDLGLIALKSISGHVFIDINDDNKADKPLKDVEIQLNSCKAATHLTTHTNEEGYYEFTGLIPSCYLITEIDPAGYTSVSDVDGENDNNITVTLTTSDILNRDFIDEPLLKVSGHVRADMDFDEDIEVASSIDKVLQNVEVTLYKGEEKISSTKTDENGFYQFVDVTPAVYRVEESDPEGFDSLRDIDLDGVNPNSIAVTVVETDIIDRDFDDQKTILVSGTIMVDIDGDRIVDEPLKDTQLLLCDASIACTPETSIDSTYTDVNGTYAFSGLKPGNYQIVEIDDKGYESLKDIDGGDKNIILVNLDGSKDMPGQDFEDLAIAPMFIKINKTTPKKQTTVGSFVPYSITVENENASFHYAAVKIKDILPAGFKYEKNSARITRGGLKSTLKAAGANTVEFGEFSLAPQEIVTISYLTKVGVAVAKGEHTNTAVAIQNDEEVSNISTATVTVIADPFIDNSVVVGKVFEDNNANGIQDNDESGIPGVRLATVTGMLIETDGYGRYHIADAESGGFAGRGSNFIVKVDDATLPKGATFTTENPRVYRVTSGQLNVIDFGVKLPKAKRLSKEKIITKVTIKKQTVEVQKNITIGSIYFDSDQDCIRPDQVKELCKIADKIKEYGNGSIMIEGNTDARAPMWYNKKLAYKRALSVHKELRHYLGDSLVKRVDVMYDNCENEVKFDPRYDWWGKKNIPRSKKECTQFGISKKECHTLLNNHKGGAL